jgi:toxin ParE1/3/4
MSREVVLTRVVDEQLDELHAHLTAVAGGDTATRYVNEILDLLVSFGDFPFRGTMRDEMYPGLRTYGWKRKATIAFFVYDTSVKIAGVYYGGRDFSRDFETDE